MRNRLVQKETWSDSLLRELPFGVRLLFMGLWNTSDDWGYQPDDPAQIGIALFPGQEDDNPIESWIDVLVSTNRLVRLIDPPNGERILWVKNFRSHQYVDKPSTPTFGDPTKLQQLRGLTGKALTTKVEELRIFDDYRTLEVPTARMRKIIGDRYGVTDEKPVPVECVECGRPGELRRVDPKYGKHDWPGAVVSQRVEVVSDSSDEDGVGLLCRTCRAERVEISPQPPGPPRPAQDVDPEEAPVGSTASGSEVSSSQPATSSSPQMALHPSFGDPAEAVTTEGSVTSITSAKASQGDVTEVFDAWVSASDANSARTKLTDERKRLIRKALGMYSKEDVLKAVRGWKNSPFHRGENDGHTRYNSLDLLLRNGDHIEKFRDLFDGGFVHHGRQASANVGDFSDVKSGVGGWVRP
jgi:hypothetical protein